MRAEYVTTFKTELQRCSQWITFLELRIEKSSAEAEDYPGYQALKDEHTVSTCFLKRLCVATASSIEHVKCATGSDCCCILRSVLTNNIWQHQKWCSTSQNLELALYNFLNGCRLLIITIFIKVQYIFPIKF